MDEVPPPLSDESVPNYKNRKTGLVLFGSLEILLGCLAGVLIALMVFGQLMMSRATHQPPQLRMILPGAVFYALVAIVLISLGIGSILARRWARALSLILSWAWLVTGVLAMGGMLVFLPKVFQSIPGGGQAMPPAALAVAMVVAFVTIGLLFIVVPGVLVLFYRSKHVKATCEARDHVPRWTDACPLPVLGLSLWLAFAAINLLAIPVIMNGVFPVFGTLLSGWSGSLVCVAVAGVWVYCALAVYRLEPAGWWLILLSMLLVAVSAWLSFSRIDVFEMYRQMGYSEPQLQMMQQFNFLTGRNLGYLSLASVTPIFLYLLFVKRFFHPRTG
jgi:hypothetical protein